MTLDDQLWLTDDPAALEGLDTFATQWQGTRYGHGPGVPGPRGGIGCIAYAIRAMVAMGHGGAGLEGMLEALPAYTDDWSHTRQPSQLDTALRAAGYLHYDRPLRRSGAGFGPALKRALKGSGAPFKGQAMPGEIRTRFPRAGKGLEDIAPGAPAGLEGVWHGEKAAVLANPHDLRPGDLALFAPGWVTHHLALIAPGPGGLESTLLHSLKPEGVPLRPQGLQEPVMVNGRQRQPLDWFGYGLRLRLSLRG